MPEHLLHREYHHLFPDSLFQESAGLASSESYLALNCALVTWNTNRNISAKSPLKYLKERVEQAALGEPEVKSRLLSHLIPFDTLANAGFDGLEGGALAAAITTRYDAFLAERAELVAQYAGVLCAGSIPSPPYRDAINPNGDQPRGHPRN